MCGVVRRGSSKGRDGVVGEKKEKVGRQTILQGLFASIHLAARR